MSETTDMTVFAPELQKPCDAFSPRYIRALLWILVFAGLFLRVVYPSATVFCKDQALLCALAEDISNGHHCAAGLINSAKFHNPPGLGYILAAVWKISPQPMAIMIFISSLNIIAVLAGWWMIKKFISPIAALWATALFATSPWAIHYCRWIWAQDLLFPVSLAVFGFVWLWMSEGRRWAVAGVILSLAVLTHIHAAGTTLALAVFLLWLWARPRIPLIPTAVGVIIAIATFAPYIAGKYFHSPAEHRMGYINFWRSYVGGVMSVTGIGWELEFRSGLAGLKQWMAGRYWIYQAVMAVPVILLFIGGFMGLKRLVTMRKAPLPVRRSPTAIAAFMVIAIPTAFSLMGAKTSPSYLPIWYPLPFIVMAWAVFKLGCRGGRGAIIWQWLMIFVMAMQLCFFAEQLEYIHVKGGYPGSHLGRSYAGLEDYVKKIPRDVTGDKLWMRFDPTADAIIQSEALAWMLRQEKWQLRGNGDALLEVNVWKGPSIAKPCSEIKPVDFLIAPWYGTQLVGSLLTTTPERK